MAGEDVVGLTVFDHDAWGDDDYLGSVHSLTSFLSWYKIVGKTSDLTCLSMAGDDVVELIVFDHDAWGDDDYLGSVSSLKSICFCKTNVNL